MIKKISILIENENYYLEGYNKNKNTDYFTKGALESILEDNYHFLMNNEFLIYLNICNKLKDIDIKSYLNNVKITKIIETTYTAKEVNILSFLASTQTTAPAIFFDLNFELDGGIVVDKKIIKGINNSTGCFSKLILFTAANEKMQIVPITVKDFFTKEYIQNRIQFHKQVCQSILDDKYSFTNFFKAYKSNDYVAKMLVDRMFQELQKIIDITRAIVDPEHLIFLRNKTSSDTYIENMLKNQFETNGIKIKLLTKNYGLGGLVSYE